MKADVAGWAVLELMGHRTRAGRLAEVEVAGQPMLRIDIPVEDSDDQFVTEFYGAAGVYSICPTTEEIVRDQHYGKRLPIQPLRFAEPAALAAPVADDEDDPRIGNFDIDGASDDDDGRPF